MDKYNVTFKGYRRDVYKGGLPSYGGVYMVYCCKYNEEQQTVTLKKLIYIGKAINIHDRINNHDRYEDFKRQLGTGEQLCYSYSSVSPNDMDVVENALIYMQKPILNDNLKDSFNYGDSDFNIEGACALLKMKNFSITT
jgi:excinuclease UvrABC nuclease subunit